MLRFATFTVALGCSSMALAQTFGGESATKLWAGLLAGFIALTLFLWRSLRNKDEQLIQSKLLDISKDVSRMSKKMDFITQSLSSLDKRISLIESWSRNE